RDERGAFALFSCKGNAVKLNRSLGRALCAGMFASLLAYIPLACSSQSKQTEMGAGGASTPAVAPVAQESVRAAEYAVREQIAPAPVKEKLASIRQKVANKPLTFQVGATGALNYKLEQIAGTKI